MNVLPGAMVLAVVLLSSTNCASSQIQSAPPASPPPSGAGVVLPDPAFTPGATNPQVSQETIGQTICASGWTATVRPPETYTEKIKHLEAGGGGKVIYQDATYQVHGFELADPAIFHFELDHLVPLELGGAPADPRNLWLEPYEAPKGPAAAGTGAQSKDAVENAARSAVCSGRVSLVDAQRAIAANWSSFGVRLGVPILG